jgi:hypothetical protein
LGSRNQWVGGGGREKVMGGECYRNTFYTGMEIAQWNPPEIVKK